MSGGSFNYACLAETLADLVEKRWDLRELADALSARDLTDAAADLRVTLDLVAELDWLVTSRLKRLQPIMKAVEWHASGDYGIEQVEEAAVEYRAAVAREAAA